MKTFIKNSLPSHPMRTTFRRWVGQPSGIAEGEAWPAHCLSLGRAEDAIPTGRTSPREHDGTCLEIQAGEREIAVTISARRPVGSETPGLEAPKWVRLGYRVAGGLWTTVGDFELAAGEESERTLRVAWPGYIGVLSIEPLPGVWSDAPGQYLFGLTVHGARIPTKCEVDGLYPKQLAEVMQNAARYGAT